MKKTIALFLTAATIGLLSSALAQGTWKELHVGTFTHLNAVHFSDSDHGFIVGDSGKIFKTVNGGSTWTDVSPTLPTTSIYQYRNVYCLNANTVFVNGNSFIKTTDGGLHWQTVPDYTFYNSTVDFINPSLGFTSGGIGMSKTTDAGATWNEVSSANYLYTGKIFFVSVDTGFMGSLQGKIYKTTDQGNTWTQYNTGTGTDYHITALYFWNSRHGIAFNSSGLRTITLDGGVTWGDTLPFPDPRDCVGAHFLNNNKGFAIFSNHCNIMTSEDGGETWSDFILKEDCFAARGIHFPSSHTGYIVGSNGGAFKYEDNATAISKQTQEKNFTLYPNPTTGILKIMTDEKIEKARVLDIHGRLIRSDNFISTIDISDLKPGIYFIQVATDEREKTFRIIKE